MYQQADRILIEKAAVVPLFYGRASMLMKPWVKRYPLSLLKARYFKDVVIEPH